MMPPVPTSVQLALGLELLPAGRAWLRADLWPRRAASTSRTRGPAAGCALGSCWVGPLGPPLLGRNCSHDKVVSMLQRQRRHALVVEGRGSSRSPAVRHPWPWATLAAGAPTWVTRGGIPESAEALALPCSFPLPGWAASGLPLQPPSSALSPAREVPWPQPKGRLCLAWGRQLTPCVSFLWPAPPEDSDSMDSPNPSSAHLPAVGGRDPPRPVSSVGEDLQPAAGAPAHAPKRYGVCRALRKLLPAQVVTPEWQGLAGQGLVWVDPILPGLTTTHTT